MMSAPSAETAIAFAPPSILRKLTSRRGLNTPAFIISIKAVPPAIGRTLGSSGSISASASANDMGCSNSNGVMARSPARPRRP